MPEARLKRQTPEPENTIATDEGQQISADAVMTVRIVPDGALPLHGWGVESPRLTIDLGLLQAAGNIAPGVNLQARHQFALGISYGF